MNMFLIETRKDVSLVKWVRITGRREYVVCYDYDETKPEGRRWYRGTYFTSLEEAVEYFSELTK